MEVLAVARQARTDDKAAAQSLAFLQGLLSDYHPRHFAVRLWDGSKWPAETETPEFTLVLKHPGALRRMFHNPSTDLYLGEAYVYDDFDIEGNIEAAFSVADYLMGLDWSLAERLRLGWDLLRLPGERRPGGDGRQAASLSGEPHSVERDRQAVTYHYDVSSDFYTLWLDSRMVYSCAYFSDEAEDLDTAQERKLDYICRKLRLRPGERLLDIGCGWGGLVMYAAQHYGVESLGITLSRPQAELADRRIQQAGLQGRCRVDVRDYREVDEPDSFDKLVSVGMFEHVGEALLPIYFERARRLLRPGGVFLNHGIARCLTEPVPKEPTFSDRYVFPDGELVPIHVTLEHAEACGFEVRDVESLREHYTLTLRHWVRRLESRRAQALALVDEPTYRVWRLFMSGSAYGFSAGRINVYQALLVKPDHGKSGLPLTRADWYR
jgi:cyclopropane-fatty-acyl-phospholipid synthase